MDYAAFLNAHDDPSHLEQPPDFDYQRAEADFAALVADIQASLDEKLSVESWDRIQDASFLGQVFLLAAEGESIVLRCSNFGRMAAIYGESCLATSAKAAVLAALAKHHYVFIPEAELRRPYSGPARDTAGITSWWGRYFEWV